VPIEATECATDDRTRGRLRLLIAMVTKYGVALGILESEVVRCLLPTFGIPGTSVSIEVLKQWLGFIAYLGFAGWTSSYSPSVPVLTCSK
jgi:hypothetical protein